MQPLNAVCRPCLVFAMDFDVLSSDFLFFGGGLKDTACYIIFLVIQVRIDMQCHVAVHLPKIPILSGVDVQDLPVMQGSSSYVFVTKFYSVFISESSTLLCVLDDAYQEVNEIIVILIRNG